MEKILIVSDSHGLTDELEKLNGLYPSLPIIHCGDSELYLPNPVIDHMHIVKGNCDFDEQMPEDKTIEINGSNFFVTHGHFYRVGRDLTTLSYKASEENAQIVCYGHTHMARAEKFNNQIFINPGSIHSPRDREEKTYAILEFLNSNEVEVNFYTIDGQLVNELNFRGQIDR